MTKDPIAEAMREGWNEAIEAAAAHLDRLATNTPLGHEDRQRGSSTYNWLRHHSAIVRSLHKPTEESET